ncbi:MAG: hypothetical protein JW953_01355 [Anaerolineae bacterium]|nr:hypothetical protein [Anaerolineae bacterium]
MSKQFLLRPVLALWPAGLLLVGLNLAACGGAAVTPETPTAPAPTEAANAPATTATEPPATPEKETEAAAEAPPAGEPEAAAEPETPVISAAGQAPGCQAVDPQSDQLTGVITALSAYIDESPPTDAIAAVTAADWVKGPANAPVTIIEYGDFQ